MQLDVVAGGADNIFSGVAVAHSSQSGRQINIEQQNLAGLDVTRDVFIPQDGYFARYIDVLRNSGTTDVKVNVKLTSQYGPSTSYNCSGYSYCYYSPGQVVATSSRNQTASTSDSWVVIDDDTDGDPLECAYYSNCGFTYNHPAVALGWYGANGNSKISA